MGRLIPYSFILVFNFAITIWIWISPTTAGESQPLKILTIGSSRNGKTDSMDRFTKFAQLNHLNVNVLNLKMPMEVDKKVNLNLEKVDVLINELKSSNYKDDDVILFTESYNFLFLANAKQIVDRFLSTKSSILLSSDISLIPCQKSFCPFKSTNFKGISGGLIAFKSKLLEILENVYAVIENDKSQKCQVNIPVGWLINCQSQFQYLDQNLVKLDQDSFLFHNLNKSSSKIKLVTSKLNDNQDIFLLDEKIKNKILVLYGSPANRPTLDFYSDQILNSRSVDIEKGQVLDLHNVADENLPLLTMAIFIQLTPFLEEFRNKILKLNYPKKRINLFIYNNALYHTKFVDDWMTENSKDYLMVKVINCDDKTNVKELHARQLAINWALETNSQYYFSVESTVHLDNPNTLKGLLQENLGVVAPMLIRPSKLWPNFDSDFQNSPIGFYDKIQNHVEITNGQRRGVWNVPFITGCYLINGTLLRDETKRPDYSDENSEFRPNTLLDMAFCGHNRRKGVFMYVSNRQDWGHMVTVDQFSKTLKKNRFHPELFEFFSNRWAWENRYLHPNYTLALKSADLTSALQPCRDVYLFPLLTKTFCDELIAEMEHHGNWSGYQVVEEKDPAPTSDIGLDQIGMGYQWFEFLRLYIQPLQKKVYPYYKSKAFATDIPFVIRYQPDGRKMLNPHLDESVYTINLALNTHGKDFEGGGVKFTRYNCSFVDNTPGWILMHPGELTHQHHGLVVTKGRRYVLISFIDPPLFHGTWDETQN